MATIAVMATISAGLCTHRVRVLNSTVCMLVGCVSRDWPGPVPTGVSMHCVRVLNSTVCILWGCVSWDWPGPVTSGVSMHGVMCVLWGCVSWDWPGPVTPINVTGASGLCKSTTSYQTAGVSMHSVRVLNSTVCVLWGCVSWDWPGPVTPIKVTGTRGKYATSYQIVTVLPALLALIKLGFFP